MQSELSVAVTYVVSHLYNKLPRRRVDMFSEELINNLTSKFDGHWYPDTPAKGSAFRCTKVTGSNGVNLDPVFEEAAKASGLVVREVIDLLPHELTMWIDPGEVSYRIGERGHVVVLLSRKQHSSLASHWLPDFDGLPMGLQNGDCDPFSAINSCVDSSLTYFDPVALLASLGLSDTSPPTNSWPASPSLASYSSPVNFQAPPFATPQPQRNQSQTFTAAMFAQTKFGSTKLRTPQQPKRPSQLSPTEPMMTVFNPSSAHNQLYYQQRHHHHQQQHQFPWMKMPSSTGSPASSSSHSSPSSLQPSPPTFTPISGISMPNEMLMYAAEQ